MEIIENGGMRIHHVADGIVRDGCEHLVNKILIREQGNQLIIYCNTDDETILDKMRKLYYYAIIIPLKYN